MPSEGRPGAWTGPARFGPLALAVLMLAAAFPPDIHPVSRGMVAVLLAVALMLLLKPVPDGSRRRPTVPTLVFLPFAALAVASAPCASRALDESAWVVLLGVTFALGSALRHQPETRRYLLRALIAVGALVAVQAILQHHLLYGMQAEALSAQVPEASAALLFRLRAGRPSGPFSLPAGLGGFLALSLPATLVACRRQGRGFIRPALMAVALLQLYALLLTQSFGALLATVAGVAIVLPLLVRDGKRRRNAGLAILGMLLLGVGGLLAARRGEFTGDPGGGPLAMRAGNWSAAARMIADRPLFGTGPGSFGTAYTRYIRQGMNETRYAHNSYLQAAAGWGIWILFPMGLFLAGRGRDIAAARRTVDERLVLLGGGAAFLLHNLVDFTAYLPGIAIPALLLLGAGRPDRGDAPADRADAGLYAGPRGSAGRRARTLRGLLAAAGVTGALLLAGHEAVAARVDLLLERAAALAAAGKIDGAVATVGRAAGLRRYDPRPRAFLAQLVLRDGMTDDALRIEGARAARAAVRLDPDAAILHYTLAGYELAAGALSEAYREVETAHRLYPLKPLYREALARHAGEEP